MFGLDMLLPGNEYDKRKIGRDKIDGLIVSTAHTTDEGYETAILDKNGVHPVERYKDLSDAVEGHQKWLDKVVGLEEVVKLGNLGIVPDEKIKIER